MSAVESTSQEERRRIKYGETRALLVDLRGFLDWYISRRLIRVLTLGGGGRAQLDREDVAPPTPVGQKNIPDKSFFTYDYSLDNPRTAVPFVAFSSMKTPRKDPSFSLINRPVFSL